jgi:RNA polymerase sigma-70 factor (ECF subfamily)
MKAAVVMADGHLREQDLIRRARSGDGSAFEALVMQHTSALYRVVRRLASDSAEAEAIVQEAFLRAWRSLARLQPDKPFFPYLVTIALNVGRDQLRRQRFLDDSLEAEGVYPEDSEPGPEELVQEAELLRALERALEDLPPAYRLAISLRYEAGMDYRQMAEALELPINTIRSHLHRAKALLRRRLEVEEEPTFAQTLE